MSASPAFALRSAAWLLALTLVALPLVGVMQGWFAVGRWPLRQLRIDGAFEHVSAAQVRAAVRPHIAPGFFAVPLDRVRAAVEQLPWVASVDVRKRWPDVLEVRLRERSAAAIWQGGELIDVEGELFVVLPESVPQGLPRFAGPRTRVREVLDFFRETAPQLTPHRMQLAAVQMSRRGGWSLRLTDGTELVLGSEDARSRLARFLAVQAPLAAAASGRMLRADLRYANGFAVAWQPAPDVPAAAAPVLAPPTPAPVPALPSKDRLELSPSPLGGGVGERVRFSRGGQINLRSIVIRASSDPLPQSHFGHRSQSDGAHRRAGQWPAIASLRPRRGREDQHASQESKRA